MRPNTRRLWTFQRNFRKNHVIIIFYLYGHHPIYFVYFHSLCLFLIFVVVDLYKNYVTIFEVNDPDLRVCAISVHISTTMSVYLLNSTACANEKTIYYRVTKKELLLSYESKLKRMNHKLYFRCSKNRVYCINF